MPQFQTVNDRRPRIDGRIKWLIWLVGSIVLLWPAMLNHGPFLFTDTTAYIRTADAAVSQITGIQTAWSDQLNADFKNNAASPVDHNAGQLNQDKRIVLAGRSIYYGLFLYFSYLIGGFWIAIILQGFLAAYVLNSMVEVLLPMPEQEWHRYGLYAAIYAIGAFCTPLPFFVCFMMPDVFTGLAIAAAALLCVRYEDTRLHTFLLTLVLFAGVVAHSSNLLVILFLLPVLVVAALFRLPVSHRSLVLIPLVAVMGIGAEFMYGRAVNIATGHPPVRPPFALARVTELGPGLRYLQAHCPDTKLEVTCSFLPRLPIDNMTFLWSPDVDKGVFWPLDPARQRRMADEQNAVIIGMLTERPIDTLSVAIPASLRMLTNLGLNEFNYKDDRRASFATKIPAAVKASVRGSPDFTEHFPVRQIQILIYVAFYGSLIVSLVSAFYVLGKVPASRQLTYANVALVVGLAMISINAAIAGNVSGDYARYNARAIWVLSVIALCVVVNLLIGRKRASRDVVARA